MSSLLLVTLKKFLGLKQLLKDEMLKVCQFSPLHDNYPIFHDN